MYHTPTKYLLVFVVLFTVSELSAQQQRQQVQEQSFLYSSKIIYPSKKAKSGGKTENAFQKTALSPSTISRELSDELSYIITGKNGENLFKSDVTLSAEKPELQLQMTFPIKFKTNLDKADPKIKDSYNFCGELEKWKGGAAGPKAMSNNVRLGIQTQFKAGVDNNLATIFDNTRLNPKSSLSVGLAIVFPTIYRFKTGNLIATELGNAELEVCKEKEKLKNTIKAYEGRIADIGTLNTNEKKVEVIELEELLKSAKKKMTDWDTYAELNKGYDKVFGKDEFQENRTMIIHWLSISNEVAYRDVLRYYPNREAGKPLFDTAHSVSYTRNISYNLYASGNKEKSFNKVYFGIKAKFAYDDKTASADQLKLEGVKNVLDTAGGITIYSPAITGDAYKAEDLKKNFAVTISPDIIWYFDKDKVIGLNLFGSVRLGVGDAPTYNIGTGLAFSIPKKGDDGKKSLINFIPFFEFKDLARDKKPNGLDRKGWDYVTVGFKAEVPFSLFAK